MRCLDQSLVRRASAHLDRHRRRSEAAIGQPGFRSLVRAPGSARSGDGQTQEQALERPDLQRRLPAGSDLVPLQRHARLVPAAVAEAAGHGPAKAATAAASDGVTGTCPAPGPIGLDHVAVGTAPSVHAGQCSCTSGQRLSQRPRAIRWWTSWLDPTECSVDQVQGSAGSVTVSLMVVPWSTSAPGAGSWSWTSQLPSLSGLPGTTLPTTMPASSICIRTWSRSTHR